MLFLPTRTTRACESNVRPFVTYRTGPFPLVCHLIQCLQAIVDSIARGHWSRALVAPSSVRVRPSIMSSRWVCVHPPSSVDNHAGHVANNNKKRINGMDSRCKFYYCKCVPKLQTVIQKLSVHATTPATHPVSFTQPKTHSYNSDPQDPYPPPSPALPPPPPSTPSHKPPPQAPPSPPPSSTPP